MAKTIATIMGVVFILVGLLGFVLRDQLSDMLGMHLSMTHNLVHLISGAVSLYFGTAGTISGARTFDILFGVVYGLLGVVGFIAGHQGAPSAGIPGPAGDNLWKVLTGNLELGAADHVVHILIGIVYLIGGLLTKADLAVDRD